MDKIIVEKYLNGESADKISKEFGKSKGTVLSWLRKFGVEIRNTSDCQRKTNINDSYFKKIDSHEKAYFLGLLYADGNITKRGSSYRIRLRLALSDSELTKAMSRALYFGEDKTTIVYRKNKKWQDISSISVCSEALGSDLIKLGCCPNKTSSISFPFEVVNKEFLPSFVLGFFDGDGCASGKIISFTSNEYFCNQLKSFLEGNGIICQNFNHRKNGYGSISIGLGSSQIELFKLLYSDYPQPLARKKRKFLSIISRSLLPRKGRNENIPVSLSGYLHKCQLPDTSL